METVKADKSQAPTVDAELVAVFMRHAQPGDAVKGRIDSAVVGLYPGVEYFLRNFTVPSGDKGSCLFEQLITGLGLNMDAIKIRFLKGEKLRDDLNLDASLQVLKRAVETLDGHLTTVQESFSDTHTRGVVSNRLSGVKTDMTNMVEHLTCSQDKE